jgi:hypothetical protein
MDKMWKVGDLDSQVGFSPIVPHGSSTIDPSGTQFKVNSFMVGLSQKVTIESCDYPGYYITIYRNSGGETHPHLRDHMLILEQGSPSDENRQFTVNLPIWPGHSFARNELFTLTWQQFIVVSGVGGLNLDPYTASSPMDNWGFVFRAVSHSYLIDLADGTKIEIPPFNLGGYSTFSMAEGMTNSFEYGGKSDYRLPTPTEMKQILTYYKSNNLTPSSSNYWTSEPSSPGYHVVVNMDATGLIHSGKQGDSYPFNNHPLPVRTI